MANSQIYVQEQQLVQRQKLTTNQVQFMRLLEQPLAQVEECVENELSDNIALIKDGSREYSDDFSMTSSGGYHDGVDTFAGSNKSGNGQDSGEADMSELESGSKEQEKEDANDSDLYNSFNGVLDDPDDDRRPMIEKSPDDGTTLYQQLMDQIQMLELTQEEVDVMEYVVGQLDDNGWLQKSAAVMSEELFLFQGLDVSESEIQNLVDQLKTLDPAGIGASSLQECLLIQVDRRKKSAVTAVMKRILRDFFPAFIGRKWRLIFEQIDEDEELVTEAFQKIRKLNPRPGADLGNVASVQSQQIVPDFIVETDGNDVTFSLNYGKIPRLAVDADWDDLVKKFEGVDREKIRKEQYEEFMWKRNRVKRAKAFIMLLQLRFHTLSLAMKHIVDRQKQFFLSGDDNDLKPLHLKDIAAEMNYDISTISRACQSKYVQTEWGIYPMKHFFLQSYGEGDEQYTLKQIYTALQEIIDSEDKKKPLSDDQISKMMKEKGFDLARRTVAKHREKLGIPVKRLRKI